MSRSGSLEEQKIPIPFVAGINTGFDPKLVDAPYLLAAENVEINKKGKLQKRSAYSILGTAIQGSSGTLQLAVSLFTASDELMTWVSDQLFAYVSSISAWSGKGVYLPAKIEVRDLIKNTFEQDNPDVGIYIGTGTKKVAVVAWEDSRTGLYLSAYDLESENFIISESQFSSTGVTPKVAINAGLYTHPVIFYGESTNLQARKITVSGPASVGSATTVANNLNSSAPLFDIVGGSNSGSWVVYNVQGASQIKLVTLNGSLAVTATATINEAASSALTLVNTTGLLYVLWSTGTTVRCAIFDSTSLTQLVAPFTVETISNVVRITGTTRWLSPFTACRVLYEQTAASVKNHRIRTSLISSAGAVTEQGDAARSVGLASKFLPTAFTGPANDYFGASDGYVMVAHQSAAQSSFFLMRQDGKLGPRLSYGVGGGIKTKSTLGNIAFLEAEKYCAVLSTKNFRKEADDSFGAFLSFKGISFYKIELPTMRTISAIDAGPEALICGGKAASYDGVSIVEQGFHLFPEDGQLAQGTGGSLTLLGNYSYQVCYEWTDSLGNLHRSAPSAPVDIVLTGSNNRVTLTVPTLRLTDKHPASVPPRTNVNICVYRTANNGTTYYRTSTISPPTYNSISSDTVSIVDDTADSTLIAREPIYTTGGQLENVGAPYAQFATVYKDRIVLAGTEDDAIWPSKLCTTGRPLEFNDSLIITPGPDGGRVTGIATLDDKCIVFRERKIEYFQGDGPNNIGGGSPFSPMTQIWNDVGCRDARSIVEFPLGILFQSFKGFYVLTRSLGLLYIGEPIKAWDDARVARAVLLADKNQIRITTDITASDLGGRTLVLRYDPESNISNISPSNFTWTTFLGTATLDSTFCGDSYYTIDQVNLLPAIETPGTYASDISMRVVTPWIALAGIEGYQRIWEAVILANYKSPHLVTIKIGYDYSPEWVETIVFDPSTISGIASIPDSAYYGLSSSSAPIESIRIRPARQKCAAIRFEISDGTLSGTNEGLELSSITLSILVKSGLNKGSR